MEICAFHAINMVQDEEGFRYPEINQSLCKSCSACSKVCHILNPPEKHPLPSPVYAIWAKDDKFRLNSASGGAASVFGDYVLAHGGFVTGVILNERFHAVMKLLKCVDEIQKSRSSKYMEVELDGIFHDTLQKLKDGKDVLFIGLPCHVAAIKTFVPKENQHNLITIELICHGVPSIKAWDHYLKQQMEIFQGKTITDCLFRRTESWGTGVSFCFSDGSIIRLKKSSYLSAFMKGYLFRESCFHCAYANKDRIGDITIGDFWQYIPPSNGGGVSYLSINTEKGHALFECVRDLFVIHTEKWENAIINNENLMRPSPRVKGRETFYQDFYAMSEDDIIEKYHLYPNLLEKILAIPGKAMNRIIRYIKYRCLR